MGIPGFPSSPFGGKSAADWPETYWPETWTSSTVCWSRISIQQDFSMANQNVIWKILLSISRKSKLHKTKASYTYMVDMIFWVGFLSLESLKTMSMFSKYRFSQHNKNPHKKKHSPTFDGPKLRYVFQYPLSWRHQSPKFWTPALKKKKFVFFFGTPVPFRAACVVKLR